MPSNGTNEIEIRKLIEDRVNAIRGKNIDGATAVCADDLLLFDVVDPLQSKGREAVRKRAGEWFSTLNAPLGYEMRDLVIEASDDVAFSHSLNRVTAITSEGQELDMWWRSTVCYRKLSGEWRATHEHNSVPFDPKSGRASLGLKP